MKTQSLLCVLVVAVTAACGSVSSPKVDASTGNPDMAVQAGDFAIAVDNAAPASTITGEVTLTVTVTRNDFPHAITLSATGLPTGVTAAFTPASIPDGISTAELKLTISNAAVAGVANLMVTGSGNGIDHAAPVALTLSTITVAGSVRNTGMGVVVRIVGKTATTTDTNGAFSFTDVIVPYDIYVIGTEGVSGLSSIPATNYYKGLTRTDPVLTRPSMTFNIFQTLPSSGTISGSRSGTGNNTDPMLIVWSTGGAVTATSGTGSYSNVAATWRPTSATRMGTLFGLQITRGTLGAPTGYPGYDETAATVTSGQNTVVNLTMAAVTTAALSGTITQPPGFPTPTVTTTQQFGTGTRDAELWTANTTNATSLIPVLTGNKSAFHATSTLNSATSSLVFPGLAAATDVTATLPTPPTITGPVNNATNVTSSTPFEFTTFASLVYKVSITSSTANFHVFTKSGSITIPNISELPVPSNTAFTWTIQGFGPATDANRAADTNVLEGVSAYDFDGAMHTHTSIPSRNFTTAQ